VSLDFNLFAALSLALYGGACLILGRQVRLVRQLLRDISSGVQADGRESFVARWAFEDQEDRSSKLAYLFTRHPPLMIVVAYMGIVAVFLGALVVLRIATTLGISLVIFIVGLPFYRAATVFDMFFLSRACLKVGAEGLSERDGEWLEQANVTLSEGKRFFRNLSLAIVLALLILLAIPEIQAVAQLQLPPFGSVEPLFSFIVLVSSPILWTLKRPQQGFVDEEPPSPFEIGLWLPGSHADDFEMFAAHRNRCANRPRRRT